MNLPARRQGSVLILTAKHVGQPPNRQQPTGPLQPMSPRRYIMIPKSLLAWLLTSSARQRSGKCLVLLPYDDVHDGLYTSMIQPAIAKGHDSSSPRPPSDKRGDLLQLVDTIRSSAVTAGITLLNDARFEQLQVYFRTLNVRLASTETPVNRGFPYYRDILGRWPISRRGRCSKATVGAVYASE
jgi:hypothetical protein